MTDGPIASWAMPAVGCADVGEPRPEVRAEPCRACRCRPVDGSAVLDGTVGHGVPQVCGGQCRGPSIAAVAAAASVAMARPSGSRSPQYQTVPLTDPRPATSIFNVSAWVGNARPAPQATMPTGWPPRRARRFRVRRQRRRGVVACERSRVGQRSTDAWWPGSAPRSDHDHIPASAPRGPVDVARIDARPLISLAGRPVGGDRSVHMWVGRSEGHGRRVKVSLGTPVADSPPLAGAVHRSRSRWPDESRIDT